MKNLFVFLFLFATIHYVAACAPATAGISPTTMVEPSLEPGVSIQLLPLNDPMVNSDLDTLLQAQKSRTADEVDLINKWHSHPVVAWNEQARYWVSYYGMDPVVATRVYALTSVVQQRALDSFRSVNLDLSPRSPNKLDAKITPIGIFSDPYESAILIGATKSVFLYVFSETPEEIGAVFEEVRQALLISGNILPSDVAEAETFGRTFAEKLIEERKDDGSADAKSIDSLPAGEGIWKPDPFRARPEQPGWGKVVTWLMASPDQFRALPPPDFGSVAFGTALEEVRQTQINLTHGEMAIAQKWADKRFSATPPGHWNAIAVDLIIKYDLSTPEASHILSALNMAEMDAGIACWDSKYHYMVIRPWQADPAISGLVGYPNHPSYPSGHSCFSGAAAETLSYFFPAERDGLWQMADEASISRLYGGIHYRFDLEAGLEIGRNIGLLAAEYASDQSWNPITE